MYIIPDHPCDARNLRVLYSININHLFQFPFAVFAINYCGAKTKIVRNVLEKKLIEALFPSATLQNLEYTST